MIKEINSLACNGGRSFDQDPSETNINKIYPSVATPAMYGQAPYTNVKKVTMQPPLTYGMKFPLNLTNTTQRQQYIDNGDKLQEIEVKKRMDDKTKSPTLFRSKAALPHKYIKDETGNWQDMGVSNEY